MNNCFEMNRKIHSQYFVNKNNNVSNQIILLKGVPGVGKTNAAFQYCFRNKYCLYFSFKNLDANIAPSIFANRNKNVFSKCNSWCDFFSVLEIYAIRKIPVVFFDNIGDRNDKDDFILNLKLFILRNKKFSSQFVFIINPWEENYWKQYFENTFTIELNGFNPVIIRKAFSNLNDEDNFRLYTLTDGNFELLKGYDDTIHFESNIKNFLKSDSRFYNLAIEYMHYCFRAPESYNTLMYGIANGYKRISELSDFSGFPKNKCDKYLKSLEKQCLIEKKKYKSGHPYYDIRQNYFRLWFKYLFSAQADDYAGAFSEETISAFMKELDKNIVPKEFTQISLKWINKHNHDLSINILHPFDIHNQNIEIDSVNFDYVEKVENRYIVMKTFGNIDTRASEEEWIKIENAATKLAPFYDITFVLCSIHRFGNFYWNLSRDLDNIHLVQMKSLNL